MFLVFENVMYFLTSIILFIWINNYVINPEEEYLANTFGDEVHSNLGLDQNVEEEKMNGKGEQKKLLD